MIDGVVKSAVNAMASTLKRGESVEVGVNDHLIEITHLRHAFAPRYRVACLTCSELLHEDIARPYMPIHHHTDAAGMVDNMLVLDRMKALTGSWPTK